MRRRDLLKGLAASPLLAFFRPREPEIVHLEPADSPFMHMVQEGHQKDATPCFFYSETGPCMNERHWPGRLLVHGGQRPAWEEADKMVRRWDREYDWGRDDDPWEWDE